MNFGSRDTGSSCAGWPWGLLGLLGLVLLVEGGVARHELVIRNEWGATWDIAGQMARRDAAKCAVLCLGDSLVKFGLTPRRIEARSGLRAWNLALPAGPAPASYFLLRRALEAGARPKFVVLDFMPHLLGDGLEHNAPSWPHLLEFRECLDLAWSARDPFLPGAVMAAGLIPTLRDCNELRAAIMAVLRGRNAFSAETRRLHHHCLRRNRGAEVADAPPEHAWAGRIAEWTRELFPNTWHCHALNATYVDRILNMAEAHGIAVYWLLPPLSPAVQERRQRLGADLEYDRFVDDVRATHPSVRVLDARHSGYDNAAFVDPIHLNRHGARALSEAVADQLARDHGGAAGPSWVTLPLYKEFEWSPSTARLADGHLEQVRR
jgi:hypothetical protein